MLKSKLFVAAALAAVAMLAIVASANASSFRVERGGSISSASSGKLTFGEGSTTIACELTLNGTLATGPIEATSGRTFGSVTEVTINRASCSGGRVENVLGLPWALSYNEALPSQAELPNNASGFLFRILGAAFLLETFFGIVDCLYRGDAAALMTLTRTRTAGVYTSGGLRSLESVTLPFVRGSEACPRNGSMSGSFGLTPTQTITVT